MVFGANPYRESARMLGSSENASITARAPPTPSGGMRIGTSTPAARYSASRRWHRSIGPSRQIESSSASLSDDGPTPFSISSASAPKPLARNRRWKNGNYV